MKRFGSSHEPGSSSGKWQVWNWYKVGELDDPLIDRLIIVGTPYGNLMLHVMRKPDGDRDMHNHPWSFWSLIIRGGYLEIRAAADDLAVGGKGDHVAVKRFNRKRAWVDYHRIIDIYPGTITLVLSGRRRNSWGFWTDTLTGFPHHMQWTRYVSKVRGRGVTATVTGVDDRLLHWIGADLGEAS